ncbi:MAG: 4-(cytidine 5'-diphospho)-2-C-methyl-D-erythritol kinase, partial [bacterium]
MIRIVCNAKLNLFLKVYSKRSDGFHDLISVMQSIDLADTLEIRQEAGDFEITCSNPTVPLDENNSVRRAAKLLSEKFGRSLDGLRIRIEKNIPVMGGLAGGSADAAGTISGLVKLWELDVPDKELLILAARIGSDVPFCMLG